MSLARDDCVKLASTAEERKLLFDDVIQYWDVVDMIWLLEFGELVTLGASLSDKIVDYDNRVIFVYDGLNLLIVAAVFAIF